MFKKILCFFFPYFVHILSVDTLFFYGKKRGADKINWPYKMCKKCLSCIFHPFHQFNAENSQKKTQKNTYQLTLWHISFFLWTAIYECQQVRNSWLSLKVSFAHIFTNLTQKYLCIFDSQFYPWRQFIWPNSLHHHKSMRVQFALQNCWKMVFCYFYHSHIIPFEGK